MSATLTRAEAKAARTSEAILAAALRLFSERDPSDVRVDEVAAASDVSVGTIYTYFGSKQHLYLRVLEEAVSRRAEFTLRPSAESSPLKRAFAFAEAYVDFGLEQPASLRLLLQRVPVRGRDAASDQAQARLDDLIARERRALERELELAVEAGELAPMPVSEATRFLWSAWDGVIAMTVREDEARLTRDAARLILIGAQRALARGLMPA